MLKCYSPDTSPGCRIFKTGVRVGIFHTRAVKYTDGIEIVFYVMQIGIP